MVTEQNGPNAGMYRQAIQGDLVDLLNDTSTKVATTTGNIEVGPPELEERRRSGNKACAARGVRGRIVAMKPR